MNAIDEPNYAALQDIMRSLVGKKRMDDLYDWQNDFVDVLAESELNHTLGYKLWLWKAAGNFFKMFPLYNVFTVKINKLANILRIVFSYFFFDQFHGMGTEEILS